MKYIKLFESFDRYEFGEISIIYLNDMIKQALLFEVDAKEEIIKIIKQIDGNSYSTGIINNSRKYEMINFYYKYDLYIELYSLGDYCFGVYMMDEYNDNRILYVVDSIDDIFPTISIVYNKIK